jgi:hypothetical protein
MRQVTVLDLDGRRFGRLAASRPVPEEGASLESTQLNRLSSPTR